MLFRGFKMELCRNVGFRSVDVPGATADGGQTVPLIKVMAAVLRHFKKDAIAYLSSTGGVIDGFIESINWVVTTPAIYDDFARRFMRMAAHQAGFIDTVDSPRLRLCLEPEAACLAVCVNDAPDLIQPGTQPMILDCGGGTVDITAHEVMSLSLLRLKELLPPTGGPRGSTYVDSQFMVWFRSFVGDDTYTMIRRTNTFYGILTQWEEHKTNFRGNESDTVWLNMVEFAVEPLAYSIARMQELRVAHNERHSEVTNLHVTGKKYIVKLPCELVKTFFAPVIDEISACLDDLKRNPSLVDLKYVFMVGGLSASQLLQDAAKAIFDEYGRHRVTAAFRPDVAIVLGAVLSATNTDKFANRKARLTYGVRSLGQYDSSDPDHVSHSPKYPHFDDDHKELIRLFSAHVNIGDDIPPDSVCPKVRYFPLTKVQNAVTISILASHRRDVKFPDEGITFPLGKVTVPVDIAINYDERGVDVEFDFRGTELSVKCFAAATGAEVGNVLLELVQEAVRTG